MTDRPLNPESVKAALCAFHGVPNDGSSWGVESCPIGAFNMTAAIRAYLAAEAERGWAMMPREATQEMLSSASLVPLDSIMPPHAGHERLLAYLAAEHTAMWDAAAKDPAHD